MDGKSIRCATSITERFFCAPGPLAKLIERFFLSVNKLLFLKTIINGHTRKTLESKKNNQIKNVIVEYRVTAL